MKCHDGAIDVVEETKVNASYIMPRPVRIRAVKHVHGFTVQLDFTDGTRKEIDLLPYLHGPIFEPLRNDPRMFQAVEVDQRMGTIVWPNGADIDPDVLYKGLTPAWVDEESPVKTQASEIRDQR